MAGLVIASALTLAMIHDIAATVLMFIVNGIMGKSKEFFRTLGARPGKIVRLDAVIDGPVAISGQLLGITMPAQPMPCPSRPFIRLWLQYFPQLF